MARTTLSSWQVPPQAAAENRKLGWLNEQTEDGLAWQKSQRGYGDWQKAFEILAGRTSTVELTSYRSSLSTARLKRNIREIRGAVCDIRPIWGYSSNNAAFQGQANMMNETTQAIYAQQFLDLSIKRVFDWSASTCTGWAHPVYRRSMAGAGRGNLEIQAYGQPSVLPSQVPSSGNYQEAYAVSLMDEMPIYMAHALFPKYQERLHPTASKYWYSAEINRAAQGNLFQRMFGALSRRGDNVSQDCFIPIRKTWIMDLSINETSEVLYLGDWTEDDRGNPVPENSWSYSVSPYGKPMPEKGGKRADVNDARIYPHRRLIISSETCVMYDGPAFDWHGELPLIPLTLDEWAFDPMGFSLVRDGYEIQKSLNELERGTMDKNRAQMDMSLAYDINAVSSQEARQYDPMQPRGRVGFDGSLVDEPFKSVVPDTVLRVAPEIFSAIEHLEHTMDYQMGINDITALTRARGLVGQEDAIDKLAQANGPVAMEITRSVERFLSSIGNQTKYIIPQYYPTQRVMQYVGPDKVTKHTFDYDPMKLIPSHLPDEGMEAHDEKQLPKPSRYTQQQRARWFCDNLQFTIAPHTAHELVQMAHKLGLLQLKKAGVQISSRTIAEAWNVGNFGGPDGNTEYDRFYAEQEDVAKHAIRIQQLAEDLKNAGGQPSPALSAALAIATGGQPQEGRPPTGLEAPRMVQKADVNGGGTRTAVSQSGS
ncbi:MAG: hypothetical protein ACREJN_21240 [Nitrospiraceae bacterium]